MPAEIVRIGAMAFFLLIAPLMIWVTPEAVSGGGVLAFTVFVAESLGVMVGIAAVLVWQGKA